MGNRKRCRDTGAPVFSRHFSPAAATRLWKKGRNSGIRELDEIRTDCDRDALLGPPPLPGRSAGPVMKAQ